MVYMHLARRLAGLLSTLFTCLFFFGVSINSTVLSIEQTTLSWFKESGQLAGLRSTRGNVWCSWQPQAIKNRFQDFRKPPRRLRVEMRQEGWLSGNLVVAAVDGYSGKASRPFDPSHHRYNSTAIGCLISTDLSFCAKSID